MLTRIKKPGAPYTSSAVDGRIVRVGSGLLCPHCDRALRGSDWRESLTGTALTCASCHTDVITLEGGGEP